MQQESVIKRRARQLVGQWLPDAETLTRLVFLSTLARET